MRRDSSEDREGGVIAAERGGLCIRGVLGRIKQEDGEYHPIKKQCLTCFADSSCSDYVPKEFSNKEEAYV